MTVVTASPASPASFRGAPPDGAPPDGAPRTHVLVIGAGLAGIAAAVRLAQAGRRVTLVEATTRLGGRATTYERSGTTFDNCQHVLLRCCTNLIDLYERLGVGELIEWHDTLHFIDRRGRHDVLRGASLPAPLHLASSLVKFRSLGWRDKIAIARALSSALASPVAERAAWHDLPFSTWLRRQRQPATAVAAFWDTVVVSALNDTLDGVSTAAALHVYLHGFMAHRDGYHVGVPRVPLARLYTAAAEIIARAGGDMLLSRPAERLRHTQGRIVGVHLKNGDVLTADAYVCAVPPYRLAHLCDEVLRTSDPRLRRLQDFDYSPTISVRICYDRRVTRLPHAALLGSPVQWVFAEDTRDDRSQVLRLVASAAREWVDVPAVDIGRRACELLGAYLPDVRCAGVMSVDVVKERRATFRPAPGSDAMRPPSAGAVDNLFLAGDWCRTGWPATMEGAVRSGYLAASAILGVECLVPGLPTPARFRVPAHAERQEATCP